MPLEIVRVDDRCIHGQVLMAWCPYVNPDRLILCDDDIAQSDWECELYLAAAAEYPTVVLTVAETASRFAGGDFDDECVFMIVRSPQVVVELMQQGLPVARVIIGGMHYESGKRKLAPFIYADDADIQVFRYLLQSGVALEGRDVPSCKPVDIAKLDAVKLI